MEEERTAKLREKKLNKEKRAKAKIDEAAPKKRACELEAIKKTKEIWTPTIVREARERLQALMKSSSREENTQENERPTLGIEAQHIARQNGGPYIMSNELGALCHEQDAMSSEQTIIHI